MQTPLRGVTNVIQKKRAMWTLAWKGVLGYRFRVCLTLIGVSLGTFALITMGSMALHFRAVALRFETYVHGKLFIRERSGFLGGGAIDEEELRDLANEVAPAQVVPVSVARLRSHELIVFGLPQLALGVPIDSTTQLFRGVSLAQGEWPQRSEECVLGANLADEENAGTFVYLGKVFRVSGVMARTNGQEDEEVVIPLETMQRLLGRKGTVSYGIVISSMDGVLENLAKSIETRHPHWEVITPQTLAKEIHKSESLWNGITLGTGLLAAVIGGIGILTAMMMSVQERIKEIAVAKSVGASNGQIFFVFLLESLIIAFIGNAIGFLLGMLFVREANALLSREGMLLFEPSFNLIGLSFGLAILLCLMGGLYPAFYGARIKIAEALRR